MVRYNDSITASATHVCKAMKLIMFSLEKMKIK